MDKLEINVGDFFEKIRHGKISQIEIFNIVEKLTDNFSIDRLKILLHDFGFYLLVEKEKKQAEFTKEHIEAALSEHHERNMKIPVTYMRDIVREKNGKVKTIITKREVLNLEALLYPFDFFFCHQFDRTLREWISKKETGTIERVTTKIENKPTFKADAIPIIFEILKDYFNKQHQLELKKLLNTSEDAKEKLLFKSSGKTLLDTFKQLISGQFVVITTRIEFEKWLIRNFMFLNREPQQYSHLNTPVASFLEIKELQKESD